MHLSPLDSVEDRERRRQYASRDDTEGKVLDERKAEGGHQHAGAAPIAKQEKEIFLLRHIPADHHQYTSQRRQGDEARQRSCDQHENQDKDGMPYAGDRAACAGANISRRARDRSGHADPAEYSRSDVRDALRHDLHIVAVLASCHAIGHFGGQQALDRPKKRERERSRQHVKYG